MTIPDPNKLNPRIKQLKDEMSRLCMALAITAREIGKAEPAWGSEITGRINSALDKAVENVARVPDELAFGIIQVAGAHVHTIGRLLLDPFTSPATVAPLARSAVEYSALLMFLNRKESPEDRTVRNARALRMGMKIDKVHRQPIAEDMYADLSRVVERYTRKHFIPELKHNEVEFSKMVEQTAGDLIGPKFYDELSSYTHHNPWKAFNQTLSPDLNPESLELESLRFAYRTSLAIVGASFTLLPYRNDNAVSDWRETLNSETELLRRLGKRIDNYIQSK